MTRSTPTAIPSIPPNDIEPYLTDRSSPARRAWTMPREILRGRNDERVVRGTGDIVYVLGIDRKAGDLLVHLPARRRRSSTRRRRSPGLREQFLGTARVEKFGELATVRIESANEEILIGDRMLPAPRETLVNYVPHAPDKPIDARILRVPYGGLETARGGIVTLDKGTQDGVEVGTCSPSTA